MMIPVVAYYFIFMYIPMYGAIIAFKDFSPATGIMGSPWVGFKHFSSFFDGMYFIRVLTNTLAISFYGIIFEFPMAIIFALLINEMKSERYKRLVQTVSYFPHFISLVVICGLIKSFTMSGGIVNDIIALFGGERASLLQQPQLFRSIYISTNIWQNIGWDTIIYLAALSAIDVQLYEACEIDGGGKFTKMFNITIPGIMPTIAIMLILRIGSILSVGFEKIILLYNPFTYKTADVISSFVYRKGLQELSWSYSAAVGLFNSAINFMFLVGANYLSKKLNDTSLW
jgi:putative aldouronate transport system permease protein